jgi:two-component system phosphate regulon sensor histidine kinase PhoR
LDLHTTAELTKYAVTRGLVSLELALTPHSVTLVERFYRTEAARAETLTGQDSDFPSSKEIADAHRGTIKVESQVGKGSIFTIILPAVPM